MNDTTRAPKSLVMHSQARYYDLLAWLLTLGREHELRERLVALAGLAPGESVLDVGCGTGTLAVAAKRRVGEPGAVHGIDASPEMIEQARRKAAKAGVDVTFHVGVVEALPFPDAHFDAVVSTLMLHHLPRPARELCAREIRRVLEPGGRVLAVDFATPARERRGLLARMHRHGHFSLRDIVELLSGAGLRVVESGSVGVSDLQFALATAPSGRDDEPHAAQPHVSRSLAPLPAPRWILPVVAIALIAAHGIVLGAAWSRLALPIVGVAGLVALLLIAHARRPSALHAFLRRRSRPIHRDGRSPASVRSNSPPRERRRVQRDR